MPGEGNKHALVAAAITGEILQKKLQVGARLPSERKLAADLGVSYMTARAGVSLLVNEGFVERRQGQGAYLIREIRPTTIAAIHLDIYDPKITYLYNLLPAFERVVKAQGLTLDVVAMSSGARASGEHGEIIRRWQRGEIKGLLIVSRYPARQVLDLIASGIPFVWIGDMLGKEPLCAVMIDYEVAFFSSIPLLKWKGGAPLHILAFRSYRIWERALNALAGMRAWKKEELHLHLYEGAEMFDAERLLDQLTFPCSLYVTGEVLYNAVCLAAAKQGISIPGQMKVIVEYVASPPASFAIPPTGWELPFEQVAQRALRMLEHASTTPPERPVIEYIPPIFRQGSTAPG